MKAPTLPSITDEPRAAFLNGWWSGIAIGIVIGLALAVIAIQGLRGHL